MSMLPPSAGYGGFSPQGFAQQYGTFTGGGSNFGGLQMGPPQFQKTGTVTGQQQAIANQLQGMIGQGPQLNPQATASYIGQSVATPLLRQFDQAIMPRLNDAYASVGALMGSRRGFAGQQAIQNLQQTIGQQLGQAQLSNQQLQANLQLGYGNLGNEQTGQSRMAIAPWQQMNQTGMGNGFQMPQFGNQQAPIASGMGSNPLLQQNTQGGVNTFSSDTGAALGGGQSQSGSSYSDYLNQLLGGSQSLGVGDSTNLNNIFGQSNPFVVGG